MAVKKREGLIVVTGKTKKQMIDGLKGPDKVFHEWFPSTGYEHDGVPELEVHLPGDDKSQDYRCQVWVSIMREKE